jgi:hypothetical protein
VSIATGRSTTLLARDRLGAAGDGGQNPVTEPAIRAARAAEIPDLGHLIAVSFNDLGANVYLVPPLADRVPVLADFFTLLTEVAAEHGRVDVIDGAEGPVASAVWFDYTYPVLEPDDVGKQLDAPAGRHALLPDVAPSRLGRAAQLGDPS